LKTKDQLRKPLASLIDPKIYHYNDKVQSFRPDQNTISLRNGERVSYDQLVVCPGIRVDFGTIKGLAEAVHDPHSPVSSIYSYETCDKVARDIANFKKGRALFTHPAGVVKCAGAPQKIMWLALDGWRRAGLYDPDSSRSDIQISFATAMPVMFGVPKYSQKLDVLRNQRGVEGLFDHDLVAVEGNTAVLARPGGQIAKKHFDFLHAVPKMGPHDFVKNSALANDIGLVDVDQATLRHKTFENVWSCGDASGLQTSKTAAAITAQAPVLVANILSTMQNQTPVAEYNGYTSCPLTTEYGKVMLAEFVYGGKPHETFGALTDQATPQRAFYHLKKDFFPWVYYKSMVKGTWAGPRGWMR
jgi:sulfide:quinone oxidoreductase